MSALLDSPWTWVLGPLLAFNVGFLVGAWWWQWDVSRKAQARQVKAAAAQTSVIPEQYQRSRSLRRSFARGVSRAMVRHDSEIRRRPPGGGAA